MTRRDDQYVFEPDGNRPVMWQRCAVIAAHPDDCDYSCGATVAKWASVGARVFLTVVTDGSKGSHNTSITDGELIARREREQRASAHVLGLASVEFLRFVDGEVSTSPDVAAALAQSIRRSRPEVVVTHDPWRRYMLHPDHRAVGQLTCDAVYRAAEPRCSTGSQADLPPWRPQELWLFTPDEPNHIEDVSAFATVRESALLEHRSQYSTSFKFDAADGAGRSRFITRLRRELREVGSAAGYEYGEEFRRLAL